MKTNGAKGTLVFELEENVDNALWSAYQRHDKSAVTKALLQRYLRPRRQEARRPEPSRG